MPRIAHYYQDCPICGRTLQVRVEYLGKSLNCPQCRGQFRAIDPSGPPAHDARVRQEAQRHDEISLMDRVNDLLSQKMPTPPGLNPPGLS